MKLRPALKIFASAALLFNILATILLFGSLREIHADANQGFLPPYLCIFGIILFSFILFLLFMFSESGTETKINLIESSEEIKAENKITDNQNSSQKFVDIEALKKKAREFIPVKVMDEGQDFSFKNFAEESLSLIAKAFPITTGIFYLKQMGTDEFIPIGDYAYFSEKPAGKFILGETLPGQVAKNKRAMNISDIPEGYIKVASGLGQSSPRHLYFLPLINNDEAIAVIELASFKEFDKETEKLFELGANEISDALVKEQTRNL
jgi:hypothetical protein